MPSSKKRPSTAVVRKEVNAAMRKAAKKQGETRRRSWTPAEVQITESGVTLANFSGGTNYILNTCLQGTDSTQRIANQVQEVGLRIKGMIYQNSANVENVCGCVRVLIVRDLDNKGTSPTLAEILDFSTAPSNLGSLVLWANRPRFKFLVDTTMTLQAQASGATSASACAPVDIDLRSTVVGSRLTYQDNTDTANALNKGGIYCYFIYCNGAFDPATGHLPKFRGVVNFLFRDT